MAQPVWTLSVDLQTRTAAFTSGLGDAARKARGSFDDIKQGAREAGEHTGFSMKEARHSVMFLGEEFGIRIPRALAGFIASLGPLGGALEAAFPFLAIIVGATLLIEHLHKLKEEGEKLTESQSQFLIATQNAFNTLDQKLLEAGIRADELTGDHLSALKKKLELIDQQSMAELVKQFDILGKAADAVMEGIQTHWYQWGSGSEKAKSALNEFRREYDFLLAQGKNPEAANLLGHTKKSAEDALKLMETAQKGYYVPKGKSVDSDPAAIAFWQAYNKLKELGLGYTENEVKAQKTLVSTLEAQERVQKSVVDLTKLNKDNEKGTTGKQMDGEAGAQERRDFEAAKFEQERADKMRDESRQKAVDNLQQAEREKIDITTRGSAERLRAVEDAIKENESLGLQESGFYKQLLNQRIEVTREMAETEARIRADAERQEAENSLRMGQLQIEADRQAGALYASSHRMRAQDVLDQEVQFANLEHALKMAAYEREKAALDRNAKDHETRLRAVQIKEEQAIKQHENRVTQIKTQAEMERNARIRSSMSAMENSVADAATRTIMREQTLGQLFVSIGDQMLAGMIKNTLLMETEEGKKRFGAARTAASKAYAWGWEHGGPAAPVLAPILGATAFAVGMAFKTGGEVPGFGNDDTVPIMATPGETVVDKTLTDKLKRMADTGGGGPQYHIRATFSPSVQALDSEGVDRVLAKHSKKFQKHFAAEVRKMNRG